MGDEHPALAEFRRMCAAEEARIRCIASPAERARCYADMNKWVESERQTLLMLIGNYESTYADSYEEKNYGTEPTRKPRSRNVL